MSAIPQQVLDAFGLRPIAPSARLQRGSLNRNFRVETERGSFFLRKHRSDVDCAWAEREHRVIAWAGDRGVPVVYPVRTTEGGTVVEADGVVWAAFPWVQGSVLRRDRIPKHAAFALGRLHGLTQRAMLGNPDASGEARLTWDSSAATERLAQLIEATAARGDADGLAAGLAGQLDLLLSGAARPVSDFAQLPVQALHMDFHDRQVIFGGGQRVVALVDWEMAGSNPRIWELLRSLSFAKLLRPEYTEAYVRGFSENVALTEQECHDGVALWWQTRLHDTWAVSEFLLRDNRRVRPFLRHSFEAANRFSDAGYRRDLAGRIWAAAH
jgi:Ser/Thr protein kinase RdoA (MazF antagonist)